MGAVIIKVNNGSRTMLDSKMVTKTVSTKMIEVDPYFRNDATEADKEFVVELTSFLVEAITKFGKERKLKGDCLSLYFNLEGRENSRKFELEE